MVRLTTDARGPSCRRRQLGWPGQAFLPVRLKRVRSQIRPLMDHFADVDKMVLNRDFVRNSDPSKGRVSNATLARLSRNLRGMAPITDAPEPIKTYSLEEVASMVLPPEWKDGARWLRRHLAAGKVPGYRVTRGVWRMTHADVEAFIEQRHNNAGTSKLPDVKSDNPEPAELIDQPLDSFIAGLSPRARKRVLNYRPPTA